MARTLENIKGKDWYKEVGGVGYKKQDVRRKFYLERVKFKLSVDQPTLDAVMEDPAKHGFKTVEDFQKAPDFTMKDHGLTLPKILEKYFRTASITDAKQIDREMYLTLYWLSNFCKDTRGRSINVDLIRNGDTIEIKQGMLTIIGRSGIKRLDNVVIRRPSGKLIWAK